jgi:hypothetical protein
LLEGGDDLLAVGVKVEDVDVGVGWEVCQSVSALRTRSSLHHNPSQTTVPTGLGTTTGNEPGAEERFQDVVAGNGGGR